MVVQKMKPQRYEVKMTHSVGKINKKSFDVKHKPVDCAICFQWVPSGISSWPQTLLFYQWPERRSHNHWALQIRQLQQEQLVTRSGHRNKTQISWQVAINKHHVLNKAKGKKNLTATKERPPVTLAWWTSGQSEVEISKWNWDHGRRVAKGAPARQVLQALGSGEEFLPQESPPLPSAQLMPSARAGASLPHSPRTSPGMLTAIPRWGLAPSPHS